MRGTVPSIHCDGDDGYCDDWEVDAYAANVSSINGHPVTSEHLALGWVSTKLEDYCPEHPPKDGTP